MKRTTAAAIIVISGMTFGAHAQAPATAPSPAAAPPAPAAAKAPARARGAPSTPADARVCLEFESNLQVIQCAEKYRYMKG